jgi:hypothetical protein
MNVHSRLQGCSFTFYRTCNKDYVKMAQHIGVNVATWCSFELQHLSDRLKWANRMTWISQSVYRLATGWAKEGSEFESRNGEEFFLHVVQTGSGFHPTSYPMGTGGSFPGGKAAGA